MKEQTLTLPEYPEDLHSFTARLLAKAQAIVIEKLLQQLAGRRVHRFDPSRKTAVQQQLELKAS